MWLGEERLAVELADKGATVEPAEVRLYGLAPMKPARREHAVLLAEPDEAEVQRLVVERAEAKPLGHGVGVADGMPVDARGLEPDGGAAEPGIQPANRALVAVGAEDQLAEGPVASTPHADHERRV